MSDNASNSLSSLPSISIHASTSELTECIARSDGYLILRDLPEAPFEPIQDLLQKSSTVMDRLNQAFPKTVLYKDNSKSTSEEDRKRSLDLSPDRLRAIIKADPEVLQAEPLQEPLEFYKSYQQLVGGKLLPALAKAIGSDAILEDMDFHYRMLDYPSIQEQSKGKAKAPPRLAAHRDFGFVTLIQATHPGLQIKNTNNGKWQSLPQLQKGSAILMFGWCTYVRSNGRIPAVLHRITQHSLLTADTSRIAAVLFCNPTLTTTPLTPILLGNHQPTKYRKDVTVGELNERLAEGKVETSVFQWLENTGVHKKKERQRFWKKLFSPKLSSTSAA